MVSNHRLLCATVLIMLILAYGKITFSTPEDYSIVYSFHSEGESIIKALQYGSISVFLYSSSGLVSEASVIRAFNLSKLLWKIKVKRIGLSRVYITDMILVDRNLIVVYSNKTLSVVNVINGNIIGRIKIEFPTYSSNNIVFYDVTNEKDRILLGFKKGAVVIDLKNNRVVWSFGRNNVTTHIINRLVNGGFFDNGSKVFILSVETYCHVCLSRYEKHFHVYDLSKKREIVHFMLNYVRNAFAINSSYFSILTTKGITIAKVISSTVKMVKNKTLEMSGLIRTEFVKKLNCYILISKDKNSRIILTKVNIPSLETYRINTYIDLTGIVSKILVGHYGFIEYIGVKKKYGNSSLTLIDLLNNEIIAHFIVKKIDYVCFTSNLDYVLVTGGNTVLLYKKCSHTKNKCKYLSIYVKGESEQYIPFNLTLFNMSHSIFMSCNASCTIRLSPGNYTLMVSSPGYKTRNLTLLLESNKTLIVELEKIRHKLRVKIFDTRGMPISAVVSIFKDNLLIRKEVIEGSKTFYLEPGLYEIEGELGRQVVSKEVLLNESREIALIFVQNLNITLNIVDHKPATIYTLYLINYSNGILLRNFSFSSDSFNIEISPGVYEIRVLAKGFKPFIKKVEIINCSETIYVILEKISFDRKFLKFYIYGSPSCPACSRMKEMLKEEYGEYSVIFRDIANETHLDTHTKIYDMLNLGSHYYIPLTIVVYNDTPLCVIIGAVSMDIVKYLIKVAFENGTLLVMNENYKFFRITDIGTVEDLKELVVESREAESRKYTPAQILPIVIAMSLADSVNPCTFSVFTALLLITFSLSREKKRIVVVGAPFIFSIFLSYIALGLGLIKIFSYIPMIKYVIIILGLSFGMFSIFSGWGGRFKSPLPNKLKRISEDFIERASRAVNPYTSALAGFTISLTLLPCSSGPYLVATAALAKMKNPLLSYLLLVLYNLIFILPLLAIMLIMIFFSSKIRTLKVWRTKKLGIMEIISGILLILISIYAIFAA